MKLSLPLTLTALAPLAWATPANSAHAKALQGPLAPAPAPEPMLDPTVSGPYPQSPPRGRGLSARRVQYCAPNFSCHTDEECAEKEDCRVKAHYDPTLIRCGRIFYPHYCVVRGYPDPSPITRRFDGLVGAGLTAPTSAASSAAVSAPSFAPTAAGVS
ncbi:hypothetical protein ACJ73_10015 [Blastomyces percursus]|uniref:Uncharacterized protein n=1 Tax=Blastomyces percursus TaxID=1658174 RepID=A0A1J9NZB6_9EURO|nr:hypothetical protein ACJ73_10015 [Blastomyces percursus]